MRHILIACAFILLPLVSFTQLPATYLNENWIRTEANESNQERIVSAVDPAGNLIYASNLNNGSNTDISLHCIHPTTGATLWQQTCNSSSINEDYATDMIIDGSGNIFLCGARYNDLDSNYDFLTAAYTPTGTLIWDHVWSRTGEDIPESITIDPSGNVYVTGTSGGLGNDIVLNKYDPTGSLQWSNVYDSASQDESAIKVLYYAGSVFVFGSGVNGSGDGEYVSLKYDLSGSLLGQNNNSSNIGVEKLADVEMNGVGEFYLGGSQGSSPNKDLKIVKLNSSLTLLWTVTNDINGRDDQINSISHENDKIAIGGWTMNTATNKSMYLATYDNTGTELWTRTISSVVPDYSSCNSVKIDATGGVFCTGGSTNSTQNDFQTYALDSTGAVIWAHQLDGGSSFDDEAKTMSLSATGELFISGFTSNSELKAAATKITTVQLEKSTGVIIPNVDTTFALGELLIQFDPTQVDLPYAHDIGKNFALLGGAVSPSVIASMTAVYPGIDWANADSYKIFQGYTPDDSTSVTRLGEIISLPDYWRSFRVTFPITHDVQIVADALNTIDTDIYYAEKNLLGHLTVGANDTDYTSEQASLHQAVIANNQDIDIETAWDIEAGKDIVKLGVCDCPVRYTHEDLSDGSGLLSGSKVVDGRFYGGTPINLSAVDLSTMVCNHGTKVAGIIGAYRNNNLGIAGIAGGGDPAEPGTGVALYSIGIGSPATVGGQPLGMDIIVLGLLDGCSDSPTPGGPGFGLHILSLSSGYADRSGGASSFNKALAYQMNRTIFRNKCLLVNSRDNDGTDNFFLPATIGKDEWLMSVGASGSTPERASFSSYGSNMDILAPGVDVDPFSGATLIWTLDNVDNGYATFDGTSAAAPHVAGVAALMMSEQNQVTSGPQNMSPEDIENFMEHPDYVLDIFAPPAAIGPDDQTGAGLLKAGQMLTELEYPEYRVIHVDAQTNVSSLAAIELGTNIVTQDASAINIDIGVGTQSPNVDVYEVTATVTHTLLAGTTILHAWKRNSSSNLGPAYDPGALTLETEIGLELISYNLNEAVLRGYFYKITGPSGIQWFPFDPLLEDAKLSYTLHTFRGDGADPFDPGTVTVDVATDLDELNMIPTLELYPNPTSSNIYGEVYSKTALNTTITIMDIYGRTVISNNVRLNSGNNQVVFNVETLEAGPYYCVITSETGSVIEKFIKL